MTRHPASTQATGINGREFTRQSIEKGIEKLRRRIRDVEDLDPNRLSSGDAAVRNVQSNIRNTIREVFGSKSPEYREHRGHVILDNPHFAIFNPAEEPARVAAGIPQTITMLKGLIARLEEKRMDLEPEPSRETTAPSDAHQTCEADCPACGSDRTADIVALYKDDLRQDPQRVVWSIDTFRILRCRGCRGVYIQRQTLCSEEWEFDEDPETGEMIQTIVPQTPVTLWPLPEKRPRPSWIHRLDPTLRNLLDEVYGALDADHRVLAAIGTRTALDHAMVGLGADEAVGFAGKLKELRDMGKVSEGDEQTFLLLTDAGSAAAHRAWRPDRVQLATLMDGMEHFLHRTFVLKPAVNAMKDTVPSRKQRSNKLSST